MNMLCSPWTFCYLHKTGLPGLAQDDEVFETTGYFEVPARDDELVQKISQIRGRSDGPPSHHPAMPNSSHAPANSCAVPTKQPNTMTLYTAVGWAS